MSKNYSNLCERFPDIFKSRGFNPVRALKPDDDDFVDDARYLAEALISTEGTKEIHFPQRAQVLVKGLLMALRVYKPGESDTLGKLRDTLCLHPTKQAEVIKLFVDNFGQRWPAIAACLDEFSVYSAEDRELAGIRRTAQIQTQWLDSPHVRRELREEMETSPTGR
jgi:type IV secretory pathway TraG/TraD family ATPase VirD4